MVQKPGKGLEFLSSLPAHHSSFAGMSALFGVPLHEQSQGRFAHQLQEFRFWKEHEIHLYKLLFLIPRWLHWDSVWGGEARWKLIHYMGFPRFSGIRECSKCQLLKHFGFHCFTFQNEPKSLDPGLTKAPTSPAWSSKSYTRVSVPTMICWWKVSSFHCLIFYVKLAELVGFPIMHIIISLMESSMPIYWVIDG